MTARAARAASGVRAISAGSSKLALGLAVGTSAAVGTAAAAGHSFSAPEVAGAVTIAGAIAVLNLRARPTAEPHVLTSVPLSTAVIVAAPRAGALVASPAGHPTADAA